MMSNIKFSNLAFGALLLVSPTHALEAPGVSLIMQSRSGTYVAVPRAVVPQGSFRTIKVTGPWMNRVTSVTPLNGVSATNVTADGDAVKMIVKAATSAPRGDMSVLMNITCGFGMDLLGCTRGPVRLPLKILETGPINHIYPNGTVPANSTVTFDLIGEGLNVAVLLPRLLTLKNASILSQTATTMKVKGTTPSCGHIDVALSDKVDGVEIPYRKGSGLEPVIAGHVCSSLAPPLSNYIQCGPGQYWDANLKMCKP